MTGVRLGSGWVRAASVLVAALLWLSAALAYALELPALRARVNDYAALMPAAAAQQLEARLAAFEAKTGHQFALLTVPNLQGVPIEEYGIKVAEAWRLGDKKRDDGLLLIISQQEHKMRIEVGYGLEGDVPDAIASRVIREVLRPAFQRGDYAGGINAAFDALIQITGGDGQPVAQPPHQRDGSSGKGSISPLLIFGFVLLFFVLNSLGGGGGRGRRRRYYGPMGGFGGFGGGSGGWGGGGFGGGGGGFSGGGGGFGGGGASGDW